MSENGLQYPAVAETADLIPLRDGRVQIRTPTSRLTIGREAELTREIFRLCNGTRTFEEIVVALRERGYPDAQVRALCKLLARRFVLVPDVPPDYEDILLAHVWHFARRPNDVVPKSPFTADESIQVCGSGHLAGAVRADLARLRIPYADKFDPTCAQASLIVACSDYENHGMFRERNRAAVLAGRPIFFACVAETGIRFGPLVIPRETACFECLHHRLRGNLSFRDEFDAYLEHNAFLEDAGIDSRAGVYARVGSGFVCAQILHFLLGSTQHCVLDKLVEVSPVTVDLVVSRLLKLPRCEVCGCSESSPPRAARDWS